tara:strand:+ start:266 stop:1072 length:807 start_codon:yes stop_codon:yes gene_type:complete
LKKLNNLSEIFAHYDTFIIDLWGVMHNGIKLNPKSIEAIEKLKYNKKKIVFLSNAPRPSEEVKKFLNGINMKEEYLKNIVTSGEAAKESLEKNKFGKYFFHLGPDRDSSLFSNFSDKKTSLEKCQFILCTGLFDDTKNDLNYYRELLKNYTSKKLICTNPDLTVHRGDIEEYCAGTLAQLFETLGGKSIYFGKPYKEIYKMCFKEGEKVIAIGDNLRTDIKGANNMKIDSIFILNGVHRSEIKNKKDLLDISKKYQIELKYFQAELTW